VQDLLDEGINYEEQMAEAKRPLRKAKGENPPEPPKRGPVPAEDIRITVEKIPPPPPPETEKWHKV
jgi:hypothetical protein